jgi:hypothetical protein
MVADDPVWEMPLVTVALGINFPTPWTNPELSSRWKGTYRRTLQACVNSFIGGLNLQVQALRPFGGDIDG